MKTVNMQKIASKITPAKHEFLNFGGGLDLTTPAINANPGTLRDSQNWYVDTSQGYKRISGYERYDGQPSPSSAIYAITEVDITGSFDVGDIIEGAVSGATAVVIAVVDRDPGGTPDTYLTITKITGSFTETEDLEVSASVEGTAESLPIIGGSDTLLLNAQYLNLAADEYRNDIAAMPGSGDTLGTFVLDDVRYGWRNNAGGTAAVLHKSTGSGWSAVSFTEEVYYTAGSGDIDDGDTLTQGGVTATVQRVVHQSGTVLPGGPSAGKLIITGRAGGNFSAGAATTDAAGALTLSGAEAAITMSPSGRVDVVVQNFGGALGTKRAYGVDGVNRGWEFDGTIFVPIDTGMAADAPTHCFEHKYHLFYSFGSSAQHSGPGTPYVWSVILGAGELAVGDDITGFSEEGGAQIGGAALAIIARNRTHILYGSAAAGDDAWNLIPYRDELGGYEWSVEQIGSTLMVDDRGITSLVTSDKFGNFEHSTLSRLIRPLVAERRGTLVASAISREQSQYRLFFAGGTAIYSTLDGTKVLGMMPMALNHEVKCTWTSELDNGDEIILFGDDAGFVYEMEKGTSFDGDPIEHFFLTHFAHLNSPHVDKEFFGGFLEVEGSGYASFSFTYELGYADPGRPQGRTVTNEVDLSSTKWDQFVWDAFYWDGRTLVPNDIEIEGNGENISIIIRGLSDYDTPIKLSGSLLQYRSRNNLRYNKKRSSG